MENINIENIFLLESSGLSKLPKIIPKNSQIITFDYDSHKYCQTKNISHSISEEFLSVEDFEKIDPLAKYFSEWSTQKTISSLVTFENLNFGELFSVEFHYFVLPIIKFFLEIKNIIAKFPNCAFFTSGILSFVAEHMKIDRISKITEEQPSFLYDDIEIKTPFLNFNLSRTKFDKIKNLSENVSNLLASKRPENSFNNVLFVEFDLERYESLFSQSNTSKLNLIIHNRRRPLYHTSKSLQIFKNSNCINSSNYFDEKIIENELISETTKKILQNINSNKSLFQNFFKIDGFSFWDIIQSSFLKLCEKRIKSALLEFFIGSQIFQNERIQKIILLSENGFNEQIFLALGKKFDVQTCLLQHGIFLDNPNALGHNIFSGIIPQKSDKFLGWGNVAKNYFNHLNYNSKIEIVGYPVFDNYLNLENFSETHILLTVTAPRKIGVKGYSVRYLEQYENTIFHICSILSKQGKKIIIKTHPFVDEHKLPESLTKIPLVQIKNNADVLELLKNSEFLIVLGISTIALEAQILGKPVIFYENNYDLGTTELTRSESCILANNETFEDISMNILNDKNFKNNLISKGNENIKNYLSNLGTSSKKMLEYLENNH